MTGTRACDGDQGVLRRPGLAVEDYSSVSHGPKLPGTSVPITRATVGRDLPPPQETEHSERTVAHV